MDNFLKGFEKQSSIMSTLKGVARGGKMLNLLRSGKSATKGLKKSLDNKKVYEQLKGTTSSKLTKSQLDRGADSLTGWLTGTIGNKTIGKRKTKRMAAAVHKAATNADTAAGKYLHRGSKKVGLKNLFTQKEYISAGKNKSRKIYRTSAMAPVSKVGKFVIPMAGMMKIEESLDKARQARKAGGATNG